MKRFFCLVTVLAITGFMLCSLTGCGKKDVPDTPLMSEPSDDVATVATVTSHNEAMLMAEAGEKPVLLIFHATWCSPCQSMSRMVWADDKVISEMKRFVVYKVDVDRERSIANRYGIRTIPAYVMLDHEGNTLRIGTGQRSTSEILDWLD